MLLSVMLLERGGGAFGEFFTKVSIINRHIQLKQEEYISPTHVRKILTYVSYISSTQTG